MNAKKLILGIIIGSIFGVIVVLIMVIVYNKSREEQRKGIQLVTNDSLPADEIHKQQILVYGDYINLDSTDYILIPLGMKTIESEEIRGLKSKSSDEYIAYDESFTNYKYNFYSLNFSNYNNIIFFNKKTDDTHLLLKEPAIITQFYFPYYNKEYSGPKYWFLLFGVRNHDSNADGYINTDDAETVYITDLSGSNKVQITPDNSQLIDWFIDEESNNILMKIREDSNKDGKYTFHDDIEILKTSILNSSIGTQIINESMRKDIMKILNKIK